jgi:hypothetical protein
VNRIDIVYGGKPYSLRDRTIESVQAEIDEAVSSGAPYWLRVNSGEGRTEDAYLLIAPAVPFAMVNVRRPTTGGPEADEGDDSFSHDVL